jgi:hypothetical protein
MHSILKIVSLLSLVVLVLPSVLFLAGRMELDTVKGIMIAASIVWFVSAAGWMWKEPPEPDKEEVFVP